jgi:hypothetical protein
MDGLSSGYDVHPWGLVMMVSSNPNMHPRLVPLPPFAWSTAVQSTVTVVLLSPKLSAGTRQSCSKIFVYNVLLSHKTTGAPALLDTPFPLKLLPGNDDEVVCTESVDDEDDGGSVGGSSHAPGPGLGR